MSTETTKSRGCPVGVIGYGRFTAEERVLYAEGKLDETIAAAQKAVPAVESIEDIYAKLFAAE